MRQPVKALLAALAAGALLAGCGSTAVEYPTATVNAGGTGGAGGDELGTTGGSTGQPGTTSGTTGSAIGGPTTLPGGTSGTTGTAGTTGTTGTSGTGGTTGSTSGGTTGPRAVNVRGVTKTSVLVGMTYSSDASTFQTTLNPNAKPGDPVAIAKTVINHINQQGGILGRKLEGVFYDQPIASQAANPAGTASAACTYFTQDRPVAWVILNTATNIDTACLARAKMPTFELNAVPADSVMMKPLIPYYHVSVGADPAKLYPKFIDRLDAQGYFKGWNTTTQKPDSSKPKVGVFLPDSPLYQRIFNNYLKPALKAHGHVVVSSFAGDPNPINRAGQENNAVLQFRAAGVTHLLTLGPAVYTGAKGADGYHYRLGVTSDNGTAGGAAGAPEAMKGALGVGWFPLADVGPKGQGAASPATNKCLAWINKDLGYDVLNQPDRYGSAASKCDAIIVFTEAMRAAGGYSPADIQRGLGLTHGKTPTAFMGDQGFTETSMYGPSSIRDVAFVESCTCFRYGSTRTPL
jgi:hypothetical protein